MAPVFLRDVRVFEKNLILLDISPELLYFSSAFGLL
jgi:hypothetical protein